MAPALTRLSFFQRYRFEIQSESSVYEEFEWLAKARGWERGSKRRTYEKAWRECFGEDVPVGIDMDASETSETAGQDEEQYARVLSDLKGLSVEGKRSKREDQLREVARQFTTYYGMDDRVLESWQQLCVDCGIEREPGSISKCKKVNGRENEGTLVDVRRH